MKNDTNPIPMPRWLLGLASIAIAAHLLAVVTLAIAAESGPWPVGDGEGWATPPHFAQVASSLTRPYLNALKMTHNYHFLDNRPAPMESRLEVRLRDENGDELTRVEVPDPQARFGVWHREFLIAQGLGEDDPIEPPPGEFVPAPDQAPRTATYWDFRAGRSASIRTVAEHLLPRDRPVFGPSAWSLLLARSLARHLCRVHRADSAEIVRISRPFIPPDILFDPAAPPAAAFEPVTVNFGVLHGNAND